MKNKFVKVAGIQTAVSNNFKNNLEKTIKLVEQAAKNGAQIICLQELYKTPYFPQYKNLKKEKYSETIPGESTKIFSVIAKKYKVVIIVPIFEKDKFGRYHNSAVVINIDGNYYQLTEKFIFLRILFFMKKIIFKKEIQVIKFTKQNMLLLRF